MYMILSILLGLGLSSFFILCVSKRENAQMSRISCCIINMAITVFTVTIAYLYIQFVGDNVSAAVIISLMIIAFETACDICYMRVYTMPVYIAYIPLIVIKAVQVLLSGTYQDVAMMLISIILFGAICHLLAILTHGSIGGGDFDMFFLVFFTEPTLAFIFIASAIVTFMRKSIMPHRAAPRYPSSDGKLSLRNRPVPFIPFLFFGYLVFLMGGAVS